ncbi:MAG: hypothetical protein FD171_289 [Actinobacteria bacterium]|nr:MAG: hypothetical protein FD171_289 [Actinomycetota bacterium]
MRRLRFHVGLALLVMLSIPQPALALTAYLRSTSIGAVGVYADSYVNDHFTPLNSDHYEAQLVVLESSSRFNQALNHQVGLAVELAEFYNDGTFNPVVHAYYDDGDYPSQGDEWARILPMSISANQWHRVKIDRIGGSGSYYWALSVDGTLLYTSFWWPYPDGNYMKTQMEAFDFASGDFMGDLNTVTHRASNGNWYLFTSGWATARNAPPGYVIEVLPHYYWVGKRTVP